MTTDDYARLGFHRFMADYHEQNDRLHPPPLSVDPAGVALEAERRSIERRTNMHKIKPLRERRSKGRRAARGRHQARRAGLKAIHATGVPLAPEALAFATSDGYSPERFGVELAQAIERSKADARRRKTLIYAAASTSTLIAGLLLWTWIR